MPALKLPRSILAAFAAVWLVMPAVPALAGDAIAVIALVKDKRLDEALREAEEFLASDPRDRDMLLIKGMLLSEQARGHEALALYRQLILDHPELPEPYNNAAVLLAKTGNYEEARGLLEAAARVDPAFATAFENLADVYLRLAERSLDKASRLDTDSEKIRSRRARIDSLLEEGGETRDVATAEETSADTSAVLQLLVNWSTAWSRKNVGAYLAFYDPEFKPSHRLSRAQWERERRARILNKKFIDLSIQRPSVTVHGDRATVRFRQFFASDRLFEEAEKSLELGKRDGMWRIRAER